MHGAGARPYPAPLRSPPGRKRRGRAGPGGRTKAGPFRAVPFRCDPFGSVPGRAGPGRGLRMPLSALRGWALAVLAALAPAERSRPYAVLQKQNLGEERERGREGGKERTELKGGEEIRR